MTTAKGNYLAPTPIEALKDAYLTLNYQNWDDYNLSRLYDRLGEALRAQGIDTIKLVVEATA